MYTAKITNKEVLNDIISLDVEFTNGTQTITEKVTPQDKNGLDHFIVSRLRSLNSLEELSTLDPTTAETYQLPQEVAKTPAELEAEVWLKKYYKWIQIKTNLIDTGVLSGNEKQVTDFLADVKAGFKPAYLNLL